MGDKATENEVLLLEHDIPHSSFSEAVLECLPTLPWEITRKVMALNHVDQIVASCTDALSLWISVHSPYSCPEKS